MLERRSDVSRIQSVDERLKLEGEKRIRQKTALLETPLGEGRVILFGFKPQLPIGQSYGTFKLLFNAIYYSSQ